MQERPVLVVDDDPGIREILALILKDEGYAVITACNGAEALLQVEQAQPACLLLDLHMPVLSGWDAVRSLRARDICLPIIVMTAAVDARRWTMDIGASAYLAKPFDLAELLSLIEQVVQADASGPEAGVADLAS